MAYVFLFVENAGNFVFFIFSFQRMMFVYKERDSKQRYCFYTFCSFSEFSIYKSDIRMCNTVLRESLAKILSHHFLSDIMNIYEEIS